VPVRLVKDEIVVVEVRAHDQTFLEHAPAVFAEHRDGRRVERDCASPV
jgi:hypothetical protein